MTTTDREKALLDLLRDPTPLCPYALRRKGGPPLQGAYGPNTCGGGCVDEPVCHTGGPWPIYEFPDLMGEVALIVAEEQVNHGNLPDDHPLFAWWEDFQRGDNDG